MRLGSIVMLLVALAFGVIAAFLAKSWLEGQSSEPRVVEVPPVEMGSIVVAAAPLRFGMQLAPGDLKETPWPKGALPSGAFAKIADIVNDKDRRVVLSAIEAGEPILDWKITGPGQRATLSALVGDGMKAVAISVSDVQNVAGFVLPGERVDVLWTRVDRQDLGRAEGSASTYTEVLLQNVRVLAVDQMADDRAEKPAVGRTVTVEVSMEDAQKIALAATIGQLSLALRKAGSTAQAAARRVSIADLRSGASAVSSDADTAQVTVTRGMEPQVYSVRRQFPRLSYSQRSVN